MKQWVILSGKGGTGKTTVMAALAHLASQEGRVVLVDADADAPNLEVLLEPHVLTSENCTGSSRAFIHASRCSGCGACAEVCRFDAIVSTGSVYAVEPTGCEGCAACFYACPVEAITMEPTDTGRLYRSTTRLGTLLHAALNPGEEASGKLVNALRQQALTVAAETQADWVIIDSSPGIGCSVIAAVSGADLALLVTEPTLSGLHDMQRALAMVRHFRIPAAACINKCDVNPAVAAEIRAFCAEQGIPVLAEIPYDDVVTAAMKASRTVTEMQDNPVAGQVRSLWAALQGLPDR